MNPFQFKSTAAKLCAGAFLFLFVTVSGRSLAAAPVVTNVAASQRPGSKLVDIFYAASGGTAAMTVTVQVSSDGGATYAVPASSFTGDVGSGIQAGSGKHIVWNAGADWDQEKSKTMLFKVTASNSPVPTPTPTPP